MNMLRVHDDTIINMDHVNSITCCDEPEWAISFGLPGDFSYTETFNTADERDKAFAKLEKILAKMEGVDEIDRL